MVKHRPHHDLIPAGEEISRCRAKNRRRSCPAGGGDADAQSDTVGDNPKTPESADDACSGSTGMSDTIDLMSAAAKPLANPLLVEPDERQAALLGVIYSGREQAGWPSFRRVPNPPRRSEGWRPGRVGAWPIFQYVEATLDRQYGFDARTVLRESPAIRFNAGQARYGWVQLPKHNPESLDDAGEIALTIAGMARLDRAAAEVALFLDVLAILVESRRSLVPRPSEVQDVSLNSTRLSMMLEGPREGSQWRLEAAEIQSVPGILQREPSTWNCQFTQDDAGGWTAVLPPFLRHFHGISSAAEYVERLRDTIAPPVAPPAALHVSSLSLPEAIDYLNAVWRMHARESLLVIPRAEAAAKLALDCASADEFDARLSAFCTILDQLQLPDHDGKSNLIDLQPYLAEKLASESVDRAMDAIDDLRAYFDLRAWRQHHGAESRGSRGMSRLGVELPPVDWGSAWQQLQLRAVAALGALREELQTLE